MVNCSFHCSPLSRGTNKASRIFCSSHIMRDDLTLSVTGGGDLRIQNTPVHTALWCYPYNRFDTFHCFSKLVKEMNNLEFLTLLPQYLTLLTHVACTLSGDF